MTADDFIHALEASKPDKARLIGLGLDEAEAGAFLASFAAEPAARDGSDGIPDPDLRALFVKYVPGAIEIGMVRFADRAEAGSRGWTIGEVEADSLVLERASGEVVVFDGASPGHVMWRCAEDGGAFLAALAVCARHLADGMFADFASSSAEHDALEAATALAGGAAYASFYRMLLGVE